MNSLLVETACKVKMIDWWVRLARENRKVKVYQKYLLPVEDTKAGLAVAGIFSGSLSTGFSFHNTRDLLCNSCLLICVIIRSCF